MHFLKIEEARSDFEIGARRAAVTVHTASGQRGPRVLRMSEPKVLVMKPDTKIVALPDDVVVLDLDDKPIKPTKGCKYYVTTETFDPFHLLTEF